MKRPESDTPAARRRAQTAANWLVRRDRGLTAAEQDEFLQWLAADPRHGEWFARHRHTVGDFGALAQWRPEHSEEPNPDLLAPPRRPVRWLAPTLLAAAAGLVVAIVWWRAATPAGESAQVAGPALERRILEDGSIVELNRDAVVTVAFSASERRATLVRGEALFSVAGNPARPFIVRAGTIDVRAIGTAFAVRLNAIAVEVLVTEGKVAVASPASLPTKAVVSPAVASLVPRTPPAEVGAGQRATVSLTGLEPPRIVAVSAEETTRYLAWQPQLLDFASAPLGVAVAEFNSRNRLQFTLADASLATRPIIASIRSNNVEGFARFLAATPGLRIERRGDTEIVVHREK